MVQQLFTQGSLFDLQTVIDYGQSVINVAQELAKVLIDNRPLSTKTVQAQMNRHFHGTAAEGTWQWKDAYEAIEVAQILYLRHLGIKILSQQPQVVVQQLEELTALCPTHTRRSEESVQLQQFSTPLPLAYLVAKAGFVQATDLVLEPSAGTGLLAQMAKLYSASLMLNELAPDRSKILRRLFPGTPLFSVNAEQINDYLVGKTQPSVVLMNPPFSASPKINSRNPDATKSHINSALQRLADGGRLVTITANWFSPANPSWRETFVKWHSEVRVLMSVGVNGKVYSKHGTTIDTRITVIDKVPADSSEIPCISETLDLPELLALIEQLPERSPWERSEKIKAAAKAIVVQLPKRTTVAQPETVSSLPDDIVVLEYEVVEWFATDGLKDTLYETYRPQRIRIKDALPHPSLLCESAALALVSPPPPTYKPHLPRNIVSQGLLSEAQLESVIYAGQAHGEFLSGSYIVDDSWDNVTVAAQGEENAVKFRRGWFLGDGTGAGKGRQCAGIILDNWCQERRKAIWVSKSSALIEDARRDWCALGGSEKDIIDLSNIKLGDPIPFTQGILFCTYSTLRSQKNGKSRLKQIVEWARADFEGAIAFDECHAMGNAMAQEGKLGMVAASQQGIVGLRLQNALPQARVVYVSATGATKVSNLSYANRLGLWQTGDFPFTSREDFVESIEGGGIAAMEVVARDLKALGLYLARSLSFDGVEYEMLEIELTPTQERIYDSYADAFQIIHNNLHKALEACNITGAKTYNRAAKMSAMSQFESHKQRFFNHLLTSMKCPKLIKAIENDLAQCNAVVIQIVSTNEELLKRRLNEVAPEEWQDLNLDLTPREYVLDYLVSAFPIHLHEIHSGVDGDERSEPAFDADGSPIVSSEAVALRDALVDKLASLDPIPGALEQLLWHFGHKQVAEVTGRSKRVLKDEAGRLFVDSRGSGANIAETNAFMAGDKQILIFSDAGGTGRSYHADLNAVNRRRRSHYLLEAGWRADNAIQGVGRTHRTNQASAPVFRPVTTNVRGERRFISTIARRLDSLGALTRGQRQTGGNGMFDAKDNLESNYAEYALYELFKQIFQGRFYQVPLGKFEQMTGLSLTSTEGGMKIDLPPLRQFLNRLLALTIGMQNTIFQRFELLLSQQIETAIANGVFEVGVETLRADRFSIESCESVYTHPQTGSVTNYLKIERVQKNNIKTADQMLEFVVKYQGQLMSNEKSGNAAVSIPTHSFFDDQGGVIPRVLLVRPQKETRVPVDKLESSTWKQVSADAFVAAWSKEVDQLPRFTTDYIHLVTGILLPIWKMLPQKNNRVYRLQTSNGEKILGRVVSAVDIQSVAEQLGLKNKLLSPQELVSLVLNEGYSQQLPGGVTLRRSYIATEPRIELVNAISLAERLLAVGCFTEIINWKKRVFIPVSDKAPAILAAVIEILG
ncbi:strawberry notch family protein [Nostoc sp. 'Peltigera membranacea cyanobiont' N6]|uniref:strawberry notch family protein n=1 Tax=Nostoc sp. 'Peltigera membranacea cyanobiont' N6 TaxID=1261031 RepID=UPI000CF3241D|nr:strawberry notch family protein [Nostoc sp. 'Peltigera membranacea cyanobiont' N6]AVH63987.1 methylase/helicase [Nostoc sp. 'Peltigera membranacea cyanobiont' N6]